MDSFSGSLPREYISFRLAKPTPETASLNATSEALDTANEVDQHSVQTHSDQTISSLDGESINQFCAVYVENKDDPHPDSTSRSDVAVQSQNSTIVDSRAQDGSQGSNTSSLASPLDCSLSSPLVEKRQTKIDLISDGKTGNTFQVTPPTGELPPITVFSELFSREFDIPPTVVNVPVLTGGLPTDPRLIRVARKEVTADLEDPRGTKRESSDPDI